MSRWKTNVVVLVGMVVVMLMTANGGAQTPQDWGPPTEIARESLPAVPLIYAAYAFVWVAVIAYVLVLWRRLGKVEQELADVRSRLAQRR